MKKYIYIILFFAFILAFTFSCKEKDNNQKQSENEKKDDNCVVTYDIEDCLGVDYQKQVTYKKGDTIILPEIKDEYFVYEEKRTSDTVNNIENVDLYDVGYIFIEWMANGESIDETYKIEEDVTVKASFDKIQYGKMSLIFHLNGGVYNQTNLKIEKDTIYFNKPTSENSNFFGWFRSSAFQGASTSKINFSDGVENNYYARFTLKPNIVVDYIASLPNEITIEDCVKVQEARTLYEQVEVSERKFVTNFEKLKDLENQSQKFEKALYIYNTIEKYYNAEKLLSIDFLTLKEIDELYNELEDSQKIVITNYDKLSKLYNDSKNIYDANINDALEFEKKILNLPSYAEKNNEDKIIALSKEYEKLDINVKCLLKISDKLDLMVEHLNSINENKIIFVTKTNDNSFVYSSREDLFKGFFTDWYYFIVHTYGSECLEDVGLYDLNEFITCASSFSYDGASNMTAIGNKAGQYLLSKDINGIKENQKDDHFIGYICNNNLYGNLADFFFNFFAYWRLDEKYANLSNYGADFFAEAWAPTVDIGKFFGYDIETCYVKTPRMQDCYLRCENVVYGLEENPLDVKLRGYIFEGWYDNPEFNGEKLKSLPTNGTVYAKWSVDKQSKDADEANKVINYIYNLSTSRAVVEDRTIGYVVDMFNNLSEEAKQIVMDDSHYSFFLDLQK